MRMHADLAARRTRVAASWIVALVATAVAATAHLLAGGAAPHAVALVVAVAISGFIGMLVVAGRRTGRLSHAGVAAAVAIDQALFHLVFTALGPGGPLGSTALGSTTPGSTTLGADAHAVHVPLASPGLGTAVVAPLADAPAFSMGAHHALAAVIAYGMLLRGTAALTAALTALGLLLARLLAPSPTLAPIPVRRAAPAAMTLGLSPAVIVLGGIGRRGPPAFASAR